MSNPCEAVMLYTTPATLLEQVEQVATALEELDRRLNRALDLRYGSSTATASTSAPISAVKETEGTYDKLETRLRGSYTIILNMTDKVDKLNY